MTETIERYISCFAGSFDALESDDLDMKRSAADKALATDPDDPFALYAKWQTLDDDDASAQISLLERAVELLRPAMRELDDQLADSDEMPQFDGRDFNADDLLQTYAFMLSDLASMRYFEDRLDEAYTAADEFMEYDRACGMLGRMIYFSILIQRREFGKAIAAADDDEYDTPFSAHCRAIALYETNGADEDASDALLEAISFDTDMVFYIIGLWDIDEEEIESLPEPEREEAEENMMSVSLLSDLWTENEGRLSFLGAMTFAIGYLTGRIDDADEVADMESSYEKIGCLEEMREGRDRIQAMIAAGRDPEAVDEEALETFRDLRDKGTFN